MANSYEQLEYLRQMRQRKNESSKYGSFVNQNDIEDIYNNLASAAKLDTDLEMVGYNEPDFSKYLKKESSGNQKVDQALSGWERTVDTINAVGYNIGSGLLNFLDSIGDFVFNTIDFLGGNVEWAQEARDYNWQDKTNAFLNITGSLLNGDMFDGSYFKALGSAEEAANYKNKIVNESNWLSELEDVNNFMSGVEESIGFMLPSIVAGIATGGSSLAAEAASMGVNAAKAASLATMFAGASASSLNEVYKETGDYGKAFAVGALKGLVEVGTELIFPESGVLGIVGGKEVTIGFKEFSKAMGKEFFEEGVEEVISALIEPAINEIWKSGSLKDAYIDNPAKFLFGVGGDFNSSVLGQGLAGGVSGILMGGTSQLATNAQIDGLVGKDGRALIAKGQALSEVLNKYLTDKAKTKVVNGERVSAYTEEQLMAKYEDELGKAGAEWLKEWANVKDKLTSKQKENLARLIENPTQALEEAKIDSEEDLSNFIERTISNSSDITKQNAMNLTKRINQVFKSNIQTDFVSEDVINDRQALEKQVGSLTDEEYEQFKNTGEAFLSGNKIILKESLKNEYNRLIAHEALSHGILDSNIELRNRLLTDLSKNADFIKEWKKQFQENKNAKDIIDLYDLPQELRNVDSKNNAKFTEAIEEMNSEQMASFVEYILSNKNLLDTLTTVSSNNLKTIIRRSIDALKGVKNSSTNKALKLLENTLKNIKTTTVKTTTNSGVSFSKTTKNFQNDKKTNQNNKIVDKTETTNYNESVYSVNVAPYKYFNGNETTIPAIRRFIENKYLENANRILKAIGLEKYLVTNNVGGYEFSGGKYVGLSANEISYQFNLIGATLEQTELFACLMADLGHETQEAVIFSSYVDDNDSSKNGNEYVIHLNIKEYKDKIVEIAKNNGVINYTYADKDGTFKVNLIDGFATEQDVINFGRFIDELKKEGYVDEQTKQQRKAINSRYYGADDRRSVYEKWAKIGGVERHGWSELSNLLSEAKERARIEIEKSKIEKQISDIIKENQNIEKYIKDDKIKLNKIVDREQVKYVIERNEYSEPLFKIAELVYKETEYEKNFVLKILTDTAKDNSIKWEENKNAQSLRKSITSIADRMYRNISKKGMEYFTPFKLHDLFRTTYIFDGLNVDNMENVVEELKPYLLVQSNNDIVKVNDTDYGYKGIHLNLKIQDIPIEIQLHSKESWKIKELQDSIYDKNRSAKVVNQKELEYSKSLNKDLDDLYYKLKAKAEEINSKFKKENKIKLSRSAKVDKLSFKNIQTTKDIVSDTKTYLEDALGDNYKISFAGGFNTFAGKAFSQINSSTVIATESNRVVDLLLDSIVEQINTDNTFVKVGKLSELIDATQKEQLISAITNLIENTENEEAKNQFTLGLEKQLNKLSDKTKEVGDRNERIRVLTNARTKIRKEIDRYHAITDDDVSRNGLKTLLQPFEQLHGSKGGFTSKGLKANINQTLAWYTEENINKNFSDLPYSDEIRNAFIDLYDSIGEPKQIVKTDSDGNEYTVESYTSLSTDSINKSIKAIELINEAIKRTNNNLITKIKPAANSSYETIKNMSYGKKRTFVRKIFESYKRGFAPAYTVLKEVLGGNSRLAKVLTYDTQNAVNKKIMYVGSYSDEINKKLKELGLKKVFDTKTYIIDGHKLTLDQTLGAYISLQVAINFNEINKHGFKYKDSDSGRVITLAEAGQAAALKEKIEKTLTKEEKLFGDFLLSTMNTSVKAEYIEWFETRFGKFNGRNEIGKVGENTYWFLNRAYMLASNIEKAVRNPNGMFSHANSRTKNDNAILLCGALSGFNGYIEQLGTELYLNPVYKEALQILNTKTSSGSTVFKLLNESIDAKDVQYIMNTMQDILGATPKQNDLLSKIMSTFSVAKLSLNIGSMGKQFASIFTSNIPLRDSTKALLLKVFQNPEAKAEYRKLFDEIGGLKYRESNKGIIRANADSLSGVGEKIAKGGMIGISKVDMFTISTGVYSLMVIGQNEYGFPIGSKENIDFVKEHWVEFELSQIGNSALSKNALARGEYGNTTKALFGFMQGANRAALGSLLNKIGLWNRNHDVDVQPIKAELEVVRMDIKTIEEEHTTDGKFDTSSLDEKTTEKYIELKTKETTIEEQLKDYDSYKIAGGKYIPAQIAAGLVAQGIFIGLITELMRHIKGKKDWDEWDLKELGLNITLSTSVDWIPFVNAISNVIKGYEFTVPSVEVLNEFVDIVNNAKNQNWKTFSRELITLLGDMTGVPVTTLYDYMYGAIKTFDPETAYKLNSLLYNTSLQSTTRTLNQYVEKGKESKSLAMVDIIMKNYKTTGSNIINTEINRLYLEGFTNTMPKSYMSSYTDDKGNKVELTKEQIELFRSIYNQADKAAEKALALADYKTKTSAEQAKILKKIYDTYYNYAKAKVLKQTKADSKISTLLLYTNGKLNVSKLSSVLEKISSIKDTKNKTRKELVIEYVNRLNVSSETKLLILNLAGYTSVSNNNRLKNYLRQLGVSNKNIESYFA